MKPVVQEEITGCAIASSAAISGVSYAEAKRVANSIGIYANDSALWSETRYIRKLLGEIGIEISEELPFDSWDLLLNAALLSTKWHIEKGKPYWHWAVFIREDEVVYVLDSNKPLKSNIRTDFWRIKPKWFIEVHI